MGPIICVPGTLFGPSMINMYDIVLGRWYLFSLNLSFYLFKKSAQSRTSLHALLSDCGLHDPALN